MRLIIGLGNPERGDDGIGRVLARDLRGRVPGDVEVREHIGDGATVFEWLEEADSAWLIDGAVSGAEPGTVHRFDAHDGPLPQHSFALSTHGLGPAEAIELARAMRCLPRRCVVYAIEGASFENSHAASDAVKAVSRSVSARILAELAE
jgi:hydrogenase maturation protease